MSCVHCTDVCQSLPVIQRRINSLTLLSAYSCTLKVILPAIIWPTVKWPTVFCPHAIRPIVHYMRVHSSIFDWPTLSVDPNWHVHQLSFGKMTWHQKNTKEMTTTLLILKPIVGRKWSRLLWTKQKNFFVTGGKKRNGLDLQDKLFEHEPTFLSSTCPIWLEWIGLPFSRLLGYDRCRSNWKVIPDGKIEQSLFYLLFAFAQQQQQQQLQQPNPSKFAVKSFFQMFCEKAEYDRAWAEHHTRPINRF